MKLTYDFECNECKEKFTITKSMNDDSEVICECGSKDVKRIYSVPVFEIKCNGFVGKIGK